MTIGLLQENLAYVGWEYKLSRYKPYVRNICINREYKSQTVDVVIISWQSSDLLDRALQNISKQTYSMFRVIYVNNGAGKELRKYASLFDVYVELSINTGAYFARNVGASMCKAPIILFLEDDGIADKQLIEAHASAFRVLDNIVSVRGSCIPLVNSSVNNLPTHYFPSKNAYSSYCSLEGNTSFLSENFFRVGGWDDKIKFGGGGIDISYRMMAAGNAIKSFLYIPWAILYHDYADNISALRKKRKRQENSAYYLYRKSPDMMRVKKSWDSFGFEENTTISTRDISCDLSRLRSEVFTRNHNEINSYLKGRVSLLALIEMCKLDHKRIVIYGSGRFGRSVASVLANRMLKVSFFVDSNPEVWGVRVNDIEISPPEKINGKTDLVFICSTWAWEIYHELPQGFNKFVVSKYV